MTQENIVLVGGQGSGKSTLIGAFVKEIVFDEPRRYETEDPNTLIERIYAFFDSPDHGGSVTAVDVDYFQDHITEPMLNQNRYPERTDDYKIEITIPDNNPLNLREDVNISFFDIGGETQEILTGGNESKLLYFEDTQIMRANLAESDLPDQSASTAREFINEVDNSDGAIFLVNLNNYVEAHTSSEEEVQTTPLAAETLETDLMLDKNKNAVVITACDLINYNPDNFEPRGSLGSIYDHDLYNTLNQQVNNFRLTNILSKADDYNNIDMFGIAVPPEPGAANQLRTQDGRFVTQGIQSLMTWALK
jgi:GTPase SAR1 family protein